MTRIFEELLNAAFPREGEVDPAALKELLSECSRSQTRKRCCWSKPTKNAGKSSVECGSSFTTRYLQPRRAVCHAACVGRLLVSLSRWPCAYTADSRHHFRSQRNRKEVACSKPKSVHRLLRPGNRPFYPSAIQQRFPGLPVQLARLCKRAGIFPRCEVGVRSANRGTAGERAAYPNSVRVPTHDGPLFTGQRERTPSTHQGNPS